MTNDIAEKYQIPAEVMAFVRDGFLAISKEVPEEATIEFDIPSAGSTESFDKYRFCVLVWIRPDRNAEFCHYYNEKPGDLPNFYVRIDTDHGGDQVEDLETVEDLVDWLETVREERGSK